MITKAKQLSSKFKKSMMVLFDGKEYFVVSKDNYDKDEDNFFSTCNVVEIIN